MNTAPKIPWSNTRQVLWAAAVFGLLLFGLLSLLDFFFGGFDIDGRKPPVEKGLTGWLSDVAAAAVVIYYILAAQCSWTRLLWRSGIAVHAVFIVVFVCALTSGGRAIGP